MPKLVSVPTEDPSLALIEPLQRMASDAYDRLTLEIEHTEALVAHLAERLDWLSAGDSSSAGRELYALSIVAEDISKRHAARIREKAKEMLDLQHTTVAQFVTGILGESGGVR